VIGRPLANADRSIVPERKVTGYLLSETHPDGRGKARFFSAHGFAVSDWRALAAALRRHAVEHPVVEEVETDFGTRYVVDGILHAPDGRKPEVRVVWFIERGEEVPRLVTAFPAKRRVEHDPGA
jgi:hypothetical protein